MVITLDSEWKDVFDFVIVNCKKPLFQKAENPFSVKGKAEIKKIYTVSVLAQYIKS